MPYKKIIKNLYLGDQFANQSKINYQLKISPNFYYKFANHQQIILKTKNFILTDEVLALNLVDSHDPDDFNDLMFAAGVKFIHECLQKNEEIFVHCQLGLSRSPSLVFIYLVSQKIIQQTTFELALKDFLTNYYPFMKVNFGVYQYIKNNFPFTKINQLIIRDWNEPLWK